MRGLWDYDERELKKSKSGRLKILERQVNFGPVKGKKVKLADVKKNWSSLELLPGLKRLMELLIWGKINNNKT